MNLLKEVLLGNRFTKSLGILFFVILLGTFSSCVSQREVEYLQDQTRTASFYEAEIPDYRLKPEDELYIQISSFDDAAANVFSGTGNQQSTTLSSGITPYAASILSYAIDKKGYLILPYIGTIFVKDKTILQVTEILKDSLSSILNQPMVSVKLVNRYISVLGEVRNPGHFAYAQEKLTIFDALGLAGDISEYGNRSEVILTRNENGKNMRISLNLTKSNVLAANYYYMRPNDIVYVKPLRKKFWGMREFPFQIVLTTISTALLIYSVVK